jgi:hypothetical protein
VTASRAVSDVEAVPEVLARVAALLSDFEPRWALCGGWGVDAWFGRQCRDHLDVDLVVFEEDQRALHAFFGEGWLLNGHDPHDDDSTHAWDGHRLELPAHVHARGHDLDLDFQLDRREGDELVIRESPRLILPVDRAIRRSAWGLPTLAPEAILFYKSGVDLRPHDRADAEILLPIMDPDAIAWLGRATA